MTNDNCVGIIRSINYISNEMDRGGISLELYAHIAIDGDKKIYQTCKEHLENTAYYMKKNLRCIGLGAIGKLIGLIHDMGKLRKLFCVYIIKATNNESVVRGSVNHSSAGCIFILEWFKGSKDIYENALSELVAYVVASHHGLNNCLDEEGKSCFERRMNGKDEIDYDECINNFFNEVIGKEEFEMIVVEALSELTIVLNRMFKNNTSLNYNMGMLARLLLSALVDADRQDTQEFMTQSKKENDYDLVNRDYYKFWDRQLICLEDNLSKINENKEKSDKPINVARRYISESCADKALEPSGLYRLDVPTGGGKTLASLRYALRHAKEYSKKRIIFVIPLLTIIDQNSKVIKDNIENEEYVLEHHSNVIMDEKSKDELDMYELLSDNWNSPIIITTMVQFLDTLFSGKMSCVRRMQALMDSVIVIDEVQSIPQKILGMFSYAMNFLKDYCNCSIVLSSATQPALDKINHGMHYSENVDVVKKNKKLYQAFNRTKVISKITKYGISIEELADFSSTLISDKQSLLVICNTKKSAMKLLKYLDLLKDKDTLIYHLSAAMCQKHREDVVDEMSKELDKKTKKVICVATQVIEAGVDISFECVIRVLAGIDSISQSAGRCNRNFDYDKICEVYIVNLKSDEENLTFLNEIKTAQDIALSLLDEFMQNPEEFENDILCQKSIEWYYSKMYREGNEVSKYDYYVKKINDTLFRLLSENKKRRDINLNNKKWHKQVLNQSFKDAGKLFTVFNENQIDVIVPYNDEAVNIIADLNSERGINELDFFKKCIQKAKKYTIHIFEHERKKLDDMGMIHEYKEGIFYSLDKQCYNHTCGFDINIDTNL